MAEAKHISQVRVDERRSLLVGETSGWGSGEHGMHVSQVTGGGCVPCQAGAVVGLECKPRNGRWQWVPGIAGAWISVEHRA